MSEIWFRVYYGYDVSISAIQIVRSTERMVMLEQRRGERTEEVRELKESTGVRWFDNFDDAARFARQKAQAKVDAAQRNLNVAMRHERELEIETQRLRDVLAQVERDGDA